MVGDGGTSGIRNQKVEPLPSSLSTPTDPLELRIIEVAPYRGTMSVNFGRSDLVMGLEAARQIWVPD